MFKSVRQSATGFPAIHFSEVIARQCEMLAGLFMVPMFKSARHPEPLISDSSHYTSYQKFPEQDMQFRFGMRRAV
jgi:hypothetical protein